MKTLIVHPHTPLKEIKHAFQDVFPSLKLEFFSNSHNPGHPSPRKEMYNDRTTVGEITTPQTQGAIQLQDDMTVQALEQEFERRFGLHVQVFRRSGSLWLETSVTDKWTLSHQNQHGIESLNWQEETE